MSNNPSTHYAEFNLPELEGEVVASSELYQQLLAHGDDIDAFLNDLNRIKTDKARDILLARLPGGSNVLCKVYRERGVLARLKCCLWQSRARQGHHRTMQLLRLGYNTPRSLGYLVRGKLARQCCSIHFSEFYSGAETLDEKLANRQHYPFDVVPLLEQLAQLFAQLHGDGYVHGDTKLTNILLVGEAIYLIDLDGFKPASRQWTPARDIARLLVGLSEQGCSQNEMALLVNSYCDEAGLAREAFKAQLLPLIDKFQRKHQQKYGVTPSAVF